jgi:uncharacterized cupin superfamily protein
VLDAGAADADTVELNYVLRGTGALLGAAGATQAVGPGDSALAPQGAASFTASGASPLVLLQVLLPGRLLRDVAAGEKTAFIHPSELGLRPEWAAPSVLKAGRVSQELMCTLLSPEAAHSDHQAARAAAAAGEGASAAGAGDAGPLASYGDEVQLLPLTGHGLVRKRSLSGVRAWQLPNATNQLALLFGPHADPGLSLTFGVEMFEPGHRTTRHIHTAAYEMFIVLGGDGLGINNKEKIPLRAGDVAVFPPHIVHAIDNPSDRRMYCLQVLRRRRRGQGRGRAAWERGAAPRRAVRARSWRRFSLGPLCAPHRAPSTPHPTPPFHALPPPQMMIPNDMFAEYVTTGSLLDPLDSDDMAGIISGTC